MNTKRGQTGGGRGPPPPPTQAPTSNLGEYDIDPSEVQILKQDPLGSGAYSNVYLGVWQGSEVAVKVMNLTRLDPVASKAFREEAHILSRLRHPNICAFYGACLRPPDVLLLVTELCPRGNLHEYLQGKLPLREKLNLFRGVAAGMRYLLSRKPPVQHRDLKSLNVLIAPDGTAKIGDFGLAKLMSPEVAASQAPTMGSCAWLAPECLTGAGKPSDKSDVYSFGVMLWEAVVDGELPWQGCQPAQVVNRVGFQGERLPIPKGCDGLLAELMHRCWAHRPEDRPTFDDLYYALDARCQGLELPFAQAVQAGQQGLPGPWTTRHSESPSSSSHGTTMVGGRAVATPSKPSFFESIAESFASLRSSAAEFFGSFSREDHRPHPPPRPATLDSPRHGGEAYPPAATFAIPQASDGGQLGARGSFYGPNSGPGGQSSGGGQDAYSSSKPRPQGRHEGYKCSECSKTPVGLRLVCEKCLRYHVCELCYAKRIHQLRHPAHRWYAQVEPRGALVRLETLPAHMQPPLLGPTASGQQTSSGPLSARPASSRPSASPPSTPQRPPGPNSTPASPFAVIPSQPAVRPMPSGSTERTAEAGEKHEGYRCSECIRVPVGPRLICERCHTYWICAGCYHKRIHQVRHPDHTWLIQQKPKGPIVPLRGDLNLLPSTSSSVL